MDLNLLKPIADWITPFANEGAKRFLRRTEGGPAKVTDALYDKLAKSITDADIKKLAEHLKKRSRYVDLRKQLNFEECMQLAIDLACEIPEETQQKVDEDWFTLWFSAVENVSEETMQSLWARAFAQKVNADGPDISLRAIDSLRLMQRKDVVSFSRFCQVRQRLGYIFINSNMIMKDLFYPHDLDDLLDLSLISRSETFLNNIAFPGGYSLYFKLPPDMFAPDPFRVLSLSSRGHELAGTLPKPETLGETLEYGLSLDDPLVVAKYINQIASGFDRRYDIVLCAHGKQGHRPPPGGWKRTHIWDHRAQKWVRREEVPAECDLDLIDALESGLIP